MRQCLLGRERVFGCMFIEIYGLEQILRPALSHLVLFICWKGDQELLWNGLNWNNLEAEAQQSYYL